MKYTYDFHIHSALSPCAHEDMTPGNIIGMARLLGFDVIALTDHNSCLNCEAAMEKGAEAGLLVIPGMELCTAEEIHVVCLLPDLMAAEGFSAAVREMLPPIQNKPAIFGDQMILDATDQIVGQEDLLLATASGISLDDVPRRVAEWGGVCFPAHVDRPSFSLLSVLGSVPPDCGFTAAEVTARAEVPALLSAHPALRDMILLQSSDAHHLEQMRDPEKTLDLPSLSAAAVIDFLRGGGA